MATARKQGDDVSADDAAILAQIQALQARLSGNARGAGAGVGGADQAAASSSSRTAPPRHSNQLAPPSPPRAGPSRSSSSSTASSSSSSYNGSNFIAQRARQGVEELKGQAQRYAAQPYRTSGGSYERQLQQKRPEAKAAGGYLAGLAARSAEREAQRGPVNAVASSSSSSTSAPALNAALSSSSTDSR